MKVSLFVTCLVDQLWTSIGVSSVEVLRRVGCEVEFDQRQTCCAQPAFNTGYRKEAREVAQRFIKLYEESDADAIVSPSGSCTAMVRHYPELFADDPEWLPRAEAIAAKTHELSSFLIRVLKVEDVGASWTGKLTWHDACHGLRDPWRRICRARTRGRVLWFWRHFLGEVSGDFSGDSGSEDRRDRACRRAGSGIGRRELFDADRGPAFAQRIEGARDASRRVVEP
jgi:hypothetical protein